MHVNRQHVPMLSPRIALSVHTRRDLLTVTGGLVLGATWPARADASPAIKATLLDGRAFATNAVKGKVLFINFWATWCGPCRAEMPAIEAYYQKRREQGLEVLALSVDELADVDKVREAAKPFSFPVAMMKAARLSGFGRIWRMPVSAVIDRNGRLVKQDWFIQPQLDADALDAVLQSLL
jgi:cytochrome c biogenesis protein CcmG, thiol:disulfide interchange protein DsbE